MTTRDTKTPEFVSDVELATLLPLSVSFIRKDRRTRRILPFSRVGDRVLYSPERVREALLALEEGGESARPARRRRAANVGRVAT